LLVDDDELELSLLADRLTAAGYRVVTAANGEQARRLLEDFAFPVIVTDCNMPDMNGLQLADAVRLREDNAADPSYIIIWSIKADEVDRALSFSHGADDHISKTISDAELLAHIDVGFHEIESRAALKRSRLVRMGRAIAERGVGRDAWNAVATRLHGEIVRAKRDRCPLTVLVLHIDHELSDPQMDADEESEFASFQVRCLVGAVNGAIRHSIDWAMPMDVRGGLARILVALPRTASGTASLVRRRIQNAVAELAVTDEFTELAPQCTIGVAEMAEWGDFPNAARLLATADSTIDQLRPAGAR
jgi:PleD family two-component response regulator